MSDTIVCQFAPERPGTNNYAYHEALSAAWDLDRTVVNIEWDVQWSHRLIDELVDCPHPLCTHAYQMHIPSTYYAHGWLPDDPTGRETASRIRWIDAGDEWANWSAIGFCKITPEARTGLLARASWQGVEMSVNRAVAEPWHVHWQSGPQGVQHFHR